MGRKQRGKAVKKNRGFTAVESEELVNAPHSFVVHKGEVGLGIKSLVKDTRKVMEPYTASHLRVQKHSVVKDYVAIAGLLHVTHLCMFTHTSVGPYLKIARLPRGPTLTFRIHDYTLAKDVLSSLKRQVTHDKQFLHHPLVIMNNFGGEEVHMKLMATMFQNMFPSININKVRLRDVRRCVLLNFDPETKVIDFRHYTIKVVPVGTSRGVKKLAQNKVPDLGKYQDIAEFVTKGGLSESEMEDDPASHVTLPQKVASRGNIPFHQSSVRLVELGPRMTLQLIKVEEKLMEGEVLYHELVVKTKEEEKLIKKRIQERARLKQQRKRMQEQNLRQKEEGKEQLKQKSLEGMKRKRDEMEAMKKLAGNEGDNENNEDDDADWYRKEVGEEPDKELFSGPPQKRTKDMPSKWKKKKKTVRFNDEDQFTDDSKANKRSKTSKLDVKKIMRGRIGKVGRGMKLSGGGAKLKRGALGRKGVKRNVGRKGSSKMSGRKGKGRRK